MKEEPAFNANNNMIMRMGDANSKIALIGQGINVCHAKKDTKLRVEFV